MKFMALKVIAIRQDKNMSETSRRGRVFDVHQKHKMVVHGSLNIFSQYNFKL